MNEKKIAILGIILGIALVYGYDMFIEIQECYLSYKNFQTACNEILDYYSHYTSTLYNLTTNLTAQNIELQNNLAELQAKYDYLKEEYNSLKEKNIQLEEENKNLKNQKGLINPTYRQLENFVLRDDTNLLEWSEDFDCTEFSYTFIKNFAKEGFYSCSAEIDFIDGAHVIVAVNTTDKGLYYVEPQSDIIIPAYKLQVGKNYCSIGNWDCNWEITKISSCFELKI